MRTTEGEDRLYNVSGAPIPDEVGGVQGAVIVMRDVTERKRLEQESAARAGQLQVLFEAVPDAITVFDHEGRMVQMNESAQRLFARYTDADTAPYRTTVGEQRDPGSGWRRAYRADFLHLSPPAWRNANRCSCAGYHCENLRWRATLARRGAGATCMMWRVM